MPSPNELMFLIFTMVPMCIADICHYRVPWSYNPYLLFNFETSQTLFYHSCSALPLSVISNTSFRPTKNGHNLAKAEATRCKNLLLPRESSVALQS